MGVLSAVSPGPEATWLEFTGGPGFAWESDAPMVAPERLTDGGVCVLAGPLEGGADLDRWADAAIDRWADASTGRHRVRFASGATVEGRIERVVRRAGGRVAYVEWRDAHVRRPGAPPRDYARYPMLAAGAAVTARAGAVDPRHHGDTRFSSKRVPAPVPGDGASARLLGLYERAEGAYRAGASAIAAVFPSVHATLARDYPDEWLLRWNLLETLLKVGGDGDLARSLRAELERLEVGYDHRQPIASGLRYLARTAA
jgi:hypothetical protein